jgi:hypothetical protein
MVRYVSIYGKHLASSVVAHDGRFSKHLTPLLEPSSQPQRTPPLRESEKAKNRNASDWPVKLLPAKAKM